MLYMDYIGARGRTLNAKLDSFEKLNISKTWITYSSFVIALNAHYLEEEETIFMIADHQKH